LLFLLFIYPSANKIFGIVINQRIFVVVKQQKKTTFTLLTIIYSPFLTNES